MIITKLYTCKTFGKYLKSLLDKEFCKLEDLAPDLQNAQIKAAKYNCRERYDKWIEKILRPEMFVNLINKPIPPIKINAFNKVNEQIPNDVLIYQKHYEDWLEAENKIIFKDFQKSSDSINKLDILHVFWKENATNTWKASEGLFTIENIALLVTDIELNNVEI